LELAPVAPKLREKGLAPPVLEVLLPTADNYRVALLQPRGQITASEQGVFNKDRTTSSVQFAGFIHSSLDVHLAVTPEYSMPWAVLLASLREGRHPQTSAIWVLGCESIKYAELLHLRDELAERADILFEDLLPDDSKFVDPVAYVFWTKRIDSHEDRLVVLVQFKTVPMGDADHFEVNGLQQGTKIYVFGGHGNQIRLATILCSDAFAFTDHVAEQLFDRSLLLHLQLNPKPRQSQYRRYRDSLFRFGKGETELLCLNWAENVEEWEAESKLRSWANVAGSAWYLQPDTFDDRDSTILQNHRRGLYYTWFQDIRSHALFFNYSPVIFNITASKVAHLAVPGSLSNRRGPQLTGVLSWDGAKAAWSGVAALDDGFANLAEQGSCPAELKNVGALDPIRAERVFALACGSISNREWYKVKKVDSFGISQSEILRRTTACQDTDVSAVAFRTARLQRMVRLSGILGDEGRLPAALKAFSSGWKFEWLETTPHQNLTQASGLGQRATVVYMGEEVLPSKVQEVKANISTYLHQSSIDADASMEAKQRLAVWYRNANGEITLYDPDRYTKFDRTSQSEVDIGRET
jgi:hypothetical protein